MNSSNQNNGEPQSINSLTLQKAFSPNKEALELLMGDQWLFERGMITERIADTLLGYAYMQPGITNVVLEIDTDEPNMGKSPRLIYKVKLEKSLYKKYSKLKSLSENPSVLNKLRTLLIMRGGTPSPGSIEQTIRMYASGVIPRTYTIDVLIEKHNG